MFLYLTLSSLTGHIFARLIRNYNNVTSYTSLDSSRLAESNDTKIRLIGLVLKIDHLTKYRRDLKSKF